MVIRKNIGKIFGLAVFENYLYWSEFTNRTVQRAMKVGGEERVVLIENQVYKPMGLKVSQMHDHLAFQGREKTCFFEVKVTASSQFSEKIKILGKIENISIF